MAVVIRLQGLPVVAGPVDIRHFFSGLNIPDGGVHIIGGEKGEAFIIFATDEDARRAMSYSGISIRGSHIELFLSSKTEMQHIIEINRKIFDRGGKETVTGSRRTGSNNPGASGVGSLSNVVAALKKGVDKSSYSSVDFSQREFHSSGSRNSSREIAQANYKQPRRESSGRYTHSKSPTRRVMACSHSRSPPRRIMACTRSRSCSPSGRIMTHTHSRSPSRRNTARTHSRSSPRRITARSYSRSPSRMVTAQTHSRSSPRRITARSHSRSPSRRVTARTHSRSSPRRITAQSHSRSPSRMVTAPTHSRSSPRTITTRSYSRSPPRKIIAWSYSKSPPRRTAVRIHSRSSPKRVITRSHSPFSGSTHSLSSHNREYYVRVQNLSPVGDKDELRLFFGELDISDDQIVFLKPRSHRSRDAIVTFKSLRIYECALKYHKWHLYPQKVHLSPISKTEAFQLIGSSETTRSPEGHYHRRGKNDQDQHSGSYTCLYVRNFPFDVTNVEVQKFFAGFNIDDRDIRLLYDDKGAGLGEALVKFRSEDEARKAESLNRKHFLGTEVLLRSISEEQMREFGINVPSVLNKKMQDHPYTNKKGKLHSQVESMQGNVKHPLYYKHSADDLKYPSDHRHPPDDSVCSPDHVRVHPTFTDVGERIPGIFPDGHTVPDSDFRSGSDRVTLIKLRNMPSEVSRDEVLDFFYGYKIIPESLFMQQNEYGMFSGDALVALINYDEAVAAVNELNDRPIGECKIRLSLV
ncbi:RNA-binding protein 12B-A-like [Pogona vitticeps]